jgi:hypothetical protein
MYNDAHLPDNEAWTNMTADLRESKQSQNAMRKENSQVSYSRSIDPQLNFGSYRQLKRRLAEVESEKEEYVFISLWNTRHKRIASILDGVHCCGHTDLSLSSGTILFIFYHLLVYCCHLCAHM